MVRIEGLWDGLVWFEGDLVSGLFEVIKEWYVVWIIYRLVCILWAYLLGCLNSTV